MIPTGSIGGVGAQRAGARAGGGAHRAALGARGRRRRGGGRVRRGEDTGQTVQPATQALRVLAQVGGLSAVSVVFNFIRIFDFFLYFGNYLKIIFIKFNN